ncbi:hypothetical protein LCGC14_1469940 [marine sediment metagenome]|uniref:Uncharacterized protein n=1 Tax=marine sediment metagenome TaxID=412755 RepID=A0A0F9MEH4_9ZZZZ|nr:hypothetical protein [Phycisphaerae bacterium]
MKSQLTKYLNFLGIGIQGDLDGITCYRSSRGALIWFPRAPPEKPPSELQIWQRERWRAILDDWNALPASTRSDWMLITERASLYIHGLNLYLWWRCSQDDTVIETLQRQTGITVLP